MRKLSLIQFEMNEQENPISFFRFEDLRIYEKALEYIKWLNGTFQHFSDHQISTLTPSFIKSAETIVLNIAEGSARNKAQFIYYLKMAKSSIRECVFHTELAFRIGAFNEEERTYSRNQLIEMTKMTGSLVASLQRGPATKNDEMDSMEI